MKQLFFQLIEDAYKLDQSDDQWYTGLAERATAVVPGQSGAIAYSFDASAPETGVRIDAWGAASVSESFVEGTLDLNRTTTPEDAIRFYHHGVLCGTVSDVLEQGGQSLESNETYSRTILARGLGDTFGLTASSPSHRGLVINAPLSSPTTLNPRVKLAWRQAGVHLHAALRLRESLRCPDVTPEAVVELWNGLVHGRWTLIESFDSDDRRFFLAYPNETVLANPRSLTARERAVVGHVVQGDSNKWIAYQLGIRPSTVARHLTSALRKMGLGQRHELIWLYHFLHRGDSSIES